MIYRCYMKRFFDSILSALAILVLSWLFIILVIIIKCTSKGPVFFKQKRVGKDKTYFNILKFRTMRIDTPKDVPTHLLTDPDQYITTIGRFLRKTSLDELPQLFNILIGDMAIVGPRPALWNQEDLIAERDLYDANAVRPGLTGLAQVSGRDELPIPVKARYDGEYVDNISLMKDMMLIVKTVGSVLKSDGVKEGGTEEGEPQEDSSLVASTSIVIQEYAATKDKAN